MKNRLSTLFYTLLIFSLISSNACFSADNRFIVLNYHDIQDDPGSQRIDDAITLSSRQLAEQFDWFKEHGYSVVSLDDIITARNGGRPLPDRAILLTFDDGYLSTYTRAFPLLKLYRYPAVIGLMTGWIETPANGEIKYGKSTIARHHFLSWPQINDMIASGLIEIASHSHDLHHDQPANPQGDQLPAASSRKYNRDNGRYEETPAYLRRIRSDLKKSMAIIKRHTGKSPRAMIWPYGRYNAETIAIARKLGMPVTMTLNDGINSVDDLPALKRLYVNNDMPLAEIIRQMQGLYWPRQIRVTHIDLDYIYDPDPGQQAKNLDRVLQRIRSLHINTVYLQAYADPDGDGNAAALYFPNRHLPVRADLFSHVCMTLRTQAGVKVYAWMPVLSFVLNRDNPAADKMVSTAEGNSPGSTYKRLSPFNQLARQTIIDIYEDLARQADFDGLLFQDDALLSDYDDNSDSAIHIYTQQWGLPPTLAAIHADPGSFRRWTELKTQWLTDLTLTLAERVRYYRPLIKTARNLYSRVVMQPDSEAWFSQSLDNFRDNYDYIAVMAMPFLEQSKDPEAWLEQLVDRIRTSPGALEKTVFELQTRDWQTAAVVSDSRLSQQMLRLQYSGALNFGYYPDDHVTGHPDIGTIFPAMSLQTFPYPKPDAAP